MQRQVTVVAWLTLIAATGCKDSPWIPMGRAELVLSEIKVSGADKVSKQIDFDENFGRSVMNGIATGDSVWLQVADKITPTSAAAEATLAIALASALPRSPDQVLGILGEKYPIDEVCGIPFPKADSTLVSTYHDEAVAALERARAPSLSAKRDACRLALDEARDRRLERINPSYIVKNKPVVPPRRVRKKTPKPRQVVTPQDTTSSD
ncbi:MAG TPA: hypothetical protein VEK37_06290 [Gemmatimonadaceae bacterium]|nr:hypothetical protein [Gemmatimonadaceae bacterium]